MLELGRERLVVVHVGGGSDGVLLLETYLQARNHLPANVFSLIVTGPQIDATGLTHPPEARRAW
jgi:predicted glycosyltransferase